MHGFSMRPALTLEETTKMLGESFARLPLMELGQLIGSYELCRAGILQIE